MRLIGLAVVLTLGLTLAPFAAEGQQAGKVWRIGYLSHASGIGPSADAFRQALRQLGYIEGQNLVIEWRFTKGRLDRHPELAAELVRLKVDCIISIGVSLGFVQNHKEQIVGLAIKSRLPIMYTDSEFVHVGGLVSYTSDRLDRARRAATFVDKILKGAKPADLPVE